MVVPALSSCDPGRVTGFRAALYQAVAANGQALPPHGGGEFLLDTFANAETTCELGVFSGLALLGGDRTYTLSVDMNITCADGRSGEAHGNEDGTYAVQGSKLALTSLRREGLRVRSVVKQRNRLIVEAEVDARSLIFFEFPPFTTDRDFPLRLEYVLTARD